MLGFYDDLRDEPQQFWVHACDFLGINPANPPDFKHKYNRSGVPRSRALHRVLWNYQLKKILRALIPYSLSLVIREKLDDINLRDFPKMGNLDLDLECSGFDISSFSSKHRRGLWSTIPRRGSFFFFNTTGSVVVRSSQGRFFLFVTCPGSTNVRFCQKCYFRTRFFQK